MPLGSLAQIAAFVGDGEDRFDAGACTRQDADRACRRDRAPGDWRAVLWLGLALGAVAGAFALLSWPAYALWLPAIWALVLAFIARRIALS